MIKERYGVLVLLRKVSGLCCKEVKSEKKKEKKKRFFVIYTKKDLGTIISSGFNSR